MMRSIPVVDVTPLFDPELPPAAAPDRALAAAARDIGFVCIRGLPGDAAPGPAERARLLAIFGLDEIGKRRLYRRKFAPENPNLYRGWFPLQAGNLTSKEGIDIGGDLVHGSAVIVPGDPLREPSPLPHEDQLPGWRAAVAAYYRALERVAQALLHSLARGLGLRADYFDDSFRHGLSTLRLIRYPLRDAAGLATVQDPAMWVEHDGARRHLVGAPHTDSGFLTLLGAGRSSGTAGAGADPGSGWMFRRWRVRWRSTSVRCSSSGRPAGSARPSIGCWARTGSVSPFPSSYEARADATIAPLPVDRPDLFAPFQYGDFLWKRMTSFVEFHGMERERSAQHVTI